jgi:hypothetical protein
LSRWVSHGCGETWQQVGNKTGHCAGCHRTFDGVEAFDRHSIVIDGKVVCRDPGTLTRRGGEALYVSRVGDGLCDTGTVYWRIAPTERDKAALARLRAAEGRPLRQGTA